MSSNHSVYLRQNVQVEPLFNNWYAWIMLVPPAPAALNLKERYLKVMRSYVGSPAMHAAAVKDPAMRGGPFIDLEGKRVDEVRQLIASTVENNQRILEFADSVQALNRLVKEKAKGDSLEAVYQDIPELLRGYVELCYDLNHQPSFRFFESLLYKSDFFAVDAQSIALSNINQDKGRPFILSTPRLKDDSALHLPVPFASPGLDELFRMKRAPQRRAWIVDQLGTEIEDEGLFDSFFSDQPPPPYQEYEGESCRIRYFGHACILLETKDINILLDPILSYTYESDISRYTYQDLPDKIDYVLITHGHQDHILLETMLQLRHKVKNIVVGRNIEGALQDPSLQLALQNLGFTNVIEVRDLQEIPIPGGSITGIPFLGEHHDLWIQSKSCFLIRLGDASVLAVADSCNIDPALYERIHAITGDLDILFLGMECDGSPASWVYGPLFAEPLSREADRSRRGRGCNYREGIDLVRRFNFKEVYVYAMGQEPWLRHILDLEYTDESNPIVQSRKLIDECRQKGMVAEYLFGERVIMPGAGWK